MKQKKPTTNSILSLLTLGGGSFGKIYKSVKRNIKSIKNEKEKFYERIKFRKFLFQLVMTPREKRNPSIPSALKERDRGWLFIPKWVFLPYLRLLDRCIQLTAHQDGLKLYGKDLIKVIFIQHCVFDSFHFTRCNERPD